MVTHEDVINAYRFILGREPESDAVVLAAAPQFESIADLRLSFLESEEFRANLHYNFTVPPPPAAFAADEKTPTGSENEIRFMQTCDSHNYLGMLAASAQTVRQYCWKNGYQYEVYVGIKRGYFPWHATFNRIFMLKELYNLGFRGWVVYVDADALIVNPDFDLREYLVDKSEIGAILTHCGWGKWWNINDGVMIFNFSHAWVPWFIEQYHAMFLRYCDRPLKNATTWGQVPSDQDLLQMLLARSKRHKAHVFFEDYHLLNCTDELGDGKRPFIRQLLRQDGSVAERTASIIAQVAEIVSDPPETWQARLLHLIEREPAAAAPEKPPRRLRAVLAHRCLGWGSRRAWRWRF